MSEEQKQTQPEAAEENASTEEEQSPETLQAQAEAKKQNIKKEIREWIITLAVALIAVFLIRTFLFQPVRVDGESMMTTLQDGERVGVTIIDVKIWGVARNDIVICHYPGRGSQNFVKRVVGMPGDEIVRKNGVTYVNGEALDPQNTPSGSRPDYEYTLGADEYFVVGDNRYNSHDSRYWPGNYEDIHFTGDVYGDVGPITSSMIVGRARFVMWPLSEIQWLE